MNDDQLRSKRLKSLQIAADRKKQFSTIAELRTKKEVTIIAHLIDFQCSTSDNLVALLDQKNKDILARMVKAGRIKTAHWQNSSVYIPTATGKKWLLENLESDEEIDRLREISIKRKILGYSGEHDLLLQSAAIKYAKQRAQNTGETWRLMAVRRAQTGKNPDAMIIFKNKSDYVERVAVEVERSKKGVVDLVSSFVRLIDSMIDEQDASVPFDAAVILCTKTNIANEYRALKFAFGDPPENFGEQPGLGFFPPTIELIGAPIPRYAVGAAKSSGSIGNSLFWGAAAKIDVLEIDASGNFATHHEVDDFMEPMFSQALWQVAMRQPEPAAEKILLRAANVFAYNHDEEPKKIHNLLTNIFLTNDDNPMRDVADLRRARQRWHDYKEHNALP